MNHTVRLALDRSVRSYDSDGRLRVATAVMTRACVSSYMGAEIPGFEQLGLAPSRVYKVLRPPEELRRALDGFNGLPILVTHVAVSATDHKPDVVIGATGSSAQLVGGDVSNALTIWAAQGIAMIESGAARQLSCGYGYIPVVRSGVFQGQSYDLVMTNIQPNHLAIVAEGRVAGAMVGDAAMPRAGLKRNMDMDLSDDDTKQIVTDLMDYLSPLLTPEQLENVGRILGGGEADPHSGAMDRRWRVPEMAEDALGRAVLDPVFMAEYFARFPGAALLKRR